MNVNSLVTTFGIVLAALLTIAGVVGTWAALRVGKNAQTLKNFRDAADSWKEKSTAQEAEIADLRHENTQLRSEVAELRGQVKTLSDLVRLAISDMTSSPTAQHNELIGRLERIVNRLGKETG